MEQHRNHTYIEPSTFRKKEIVETNVRFHDEVPIFNILGNSMDKFEILAH